MTTMIPAGAEATTLKPVAPFVGDGVLFGLLALWRKNLRPGIMAHALTDILAGIVRV